MTKNKQATRYYSDLQENAVSKAICGRKTWASGSGAFDKTDVVSKRFAIECKTAMTEKKSFSIKKEWIDKLIEQSFSNKRDHWALAFNFGGEANSRNNYYIISENDFNTLKGVIESE